MTTFKVLFFVPNHPEEELNNKIVEMPIIPRTGDFVDLTFIPNIKEQPNNYLSVIGEVTTVYVNNIENKKFDAQVHVRLDDPKYI